MAHIPIIEKLIVLKSKGLHSFKISTHNEQIFAITTKTIPEKKLCEYSDIHLGLLHETP